MKRVLPIAVVLLLAGLAVAYRTPLAKWVTATYGRLRGLQETTDMRLLASGTIEASHLDVSSPIGGRIAAIHVVEGQHVDAGQLIAELETTAADVEIAQRQAARDRASAQLALLRAGVREADIAVAQANVKRAEAARAAAASAADDAWAMIDAPSDLDVSIAQGAGIARAATERLEAAEAAATSADLEQQLWGRIVQRLEAGFDVELPIPGGGAVHVDAPAEKLADARLQWNLASQRSWEAHANVAVATAVRDAALQALSDLRSQRSDPIRLRAQADAATAARAVAEAAVKTALTQLAALRAEAQSELIAAAEARVTQAEAAIEALRSQRAQARLNAPQDGIVESVVLRAGEIEAPAAAIVRLVDPSSTTLTLYVPEPQIGAVTPGAMVRAKVDSFPDRVFEGTVTRIAERAEYTPKNVQTREQRASIVFAVEVSLPNPDGALKPGMPADAVFCGPSETPCSRPGAESAVSQSSSALDTNSPIAASGTIEGTETAIASEIGGRALKVDCSEGNDIAAGQVVVEIDGEEMHARRAQAEAALQAAAAELARVTAPPRAAQIAQAEAEVGQAEAALGAAHTALANAGALRDNPQELNARISGARSQIRTAVAAVDAARAAVKAAEVLQQSLPNPGSDEDRTRRAIYDQSVAAAQARLRAAETDERTARAVLAELLKISEEPLVLVAAVRRAEEAARVAAADVDLARARLAQVQAPAQAEAIEVAKAGVREAEAALAWVGVNEARLFVRSPVSGTVTSQAIHAGEVVRAGAALCTVSDLRRVHLVVYVPTSQIGRVSLGQDASVQVDAYPGRQFLGRVARIGEQAEYTPKNVQTQEERVKTVFAVELALENEGGLLRAGMPADATLIVAGG